MPKLITVSLLFIFLSACAIAAFPKIEDSSVERFVNQEAQPILQVEHIRSLSEYKFYLTDKTIGASAGNGEIYVNYTIAKRAMIENLGSRWDAKAKEWISYATESSVRSFLRLTLAHELAHDALGHRANKQVLAAILSGISAAAPGVIGLALGLAARVTSELYSRAAELQADRKGIEYFKKLGWDCRVWTRLFDNLLEKGNTGDFHHPTEERLTQAVDLCLSKNDPERVAIEKRLEERWRKQKEEKALEEDSHSKD
jgi:hypothetical protein